jgi:hypothetical protein
MQVGVTRQTPQRGVWLARPPICDTPGFSRTGTRAPATLREDCGTPNQDGGCGNFGCPAFDHREEQARIDGVQIYGTRAVLSCVQSLKRLVGGRLNGAGSHFTRAPGYKHQPTLQN